MLSERTRAEAPQAPAAPPAGEPLIRRALRLLPATVVLAAAVFVLWRQGVDLSTQTRFAAHTIGVVMLPGILVWRALRGRAGTLPMDLTGGVALGYTMEIGWYLAGRAAGFPYLHVVAAGATIVAFVAVPGLRRHWRGSGRPTDARWAWAVTVLCLSMLAWAWASFYDPHDLHWPGAGNPYQDMVFHQAVAAELRHHLPAQIPYVQGVPLAYHWFVHAEWAAASWSTGIEPFLLTYRLGLLPAAVLIVVAIAAVAQRLVPGRWWSGPLAAALALFAVPWRPAGGGSATAHIPGTMWLSPSQTFGGLLFAGAILALADLLRPEDPDERPSAGRWVAFGLIVAGATGGKATYAPLLLAGLGAVVAVGLLRRRFEKRALAAAVLTLVTFGVAMRLMFPGTTGGLFLDPLASARAFAPGWTVGHVLVIWALGWAVILGAGVVLLLRRGWADPMLVLCAGIAAAALGLVLLTRQLGASQMYFLVSARPYIAVLIVAALVAVAPGVAVPRWVGWLLIPAVLGGTAVGVLTQDLSGERPPAGGLVAIVGPYAVPLLAAAALGVLLYAVRRARPVALVAAAALLIGAVVPQSINEVHVRPTNVGAPADRPATWQPKIPPGAPAAGRWLRANTSPDDLLATNSHCLLPGRVCDPRKFWLSAFGERRVLVEGWGYTPPANEIGVRDDLPSYRIPFWDPELLAENDAAFQQPSPEAVGRLRDRYGVDWLVVDTRHPYDPEALEQVAELRHRAGEVAIYQAR